MPVRPNFMTVANSEDGFIEINLADDKSITGFGDPVKVSTAKEMISNYLTDYKKISRFIQEVDRDPQYEDLRSKAGFQALKNIMIPENNILSGVFGKEAILQLLAQENCEGFRYVIAKNDDSKITIVLMGVKKASLTEEQSQEEARRESVQANDGGIDPLSYEQPSEPIPNENFFMRLADRQIHKSFHPLLIEVHKSSKIDSEIRRLWNIPDEEGPVVDNAIKHVTNFTFSAF